MENISKQRREVLLREIGEIRNKLQENADKNTNQLLVYLSNIEQDINGLKYGLVFEEHKEAVDMFLENNVPIVIENENLKVNNGGTQNFLIEGDNLASLKLLEKTHKGKIDLIYIDPPYNTGNKDFIYDDAFVDSEDKFKHSKWLSFIKQRLNYAYKLMSKSGVIFISIDDNEQAQLKILCDSIFGEKNFAGNIIQEKCNAQNDAHNLQKNHEFILVYFKNLNNHPHLLSSIDYDVVNIYQDQFGYYYKGSGIVTGGEGGTLNRRPNLGHSIYYNEQTGDIIAVDDYDKIKALTSNDVDEVYNENKELIEKGYVAIRPPQKGDKLGVWTWSLEKINRNKNELLITKNNNGYSIIKKVYIDEKELDFSSKSIQYKKKKQLPAKSVIKFPTAKGSAVLNELLGMKSFDNPKNPDLIEYLIKLYSNKNPIILDFFAGSGTTGHAVMKLNAEDGGERKFILCTNNENNICRDVTYERIKRVIVKEGYKASLKYYKVDFVPVSEQVYYEYADKLLLHIKELVELENGLDFDGNKKVAICRTDEELTSFVNGLENKTTYKAVYVGHDVFVSPDKEEKLLALKLKINRIPDYYYSELRG